MQEIYAGASLWIIGEDKMGKYECDICGYTLTHNQEFHGKCPRCGASAFERHTTRKTKMKQNHVKWPEKIYL